MADTGSQTTVSDAEIMAAADEQAVIDFARVMVRKMAISREKGRDGWQTCPVYELWAMLREHVDKGDPVDVANFAMMIYRNQGKAL